jgi:sec-independent protein translocase protein TatB
MDLGIGTAELIVIAAVALIVVGPKDLPVLMRKIGGFMSKMRGLASEFRASFDEMARQAELDELRKEVEQLRQGRLGDDVRGDVEGAFRAIDEDMAMPGLGAMAPVAPNAGQAAPDDQGELDFVAPVPEPDPDAPSEPRP